jgi:DNA-binding winged helix-turn-helix (wHTH) protein
MMKKDKHILRFGSFIMDIEDRLLLQNGTPISLFPRAFDLLVVLVTNSGRLLGKGELLKQVWKDVNIEEARISYNIMLLRKALGDGVKPKYIETVPKMGYRFIAPVQQMTSKIISGTGQAGTNFYDVANETGVSTKIPRAFISYSWDSDEHKQWVCGLATKLRHDGVDVMLDQWGVAPGDQLPEFMEHSLRENDFVLVVCTPEYKRKSDARIGGVGYEGHIITAELFTARNNRKFIPILHHGNWEEASPSWLIGKYYIDLYRVDRFEAGYQDLLVTLHGQRMKAPPLGKPPVLNAASEGKSSNAVTSHAPESAADPSELIKISRIVTEAITAPRNDGTRGSGLYAIPFQLSRRPSPEWARLFVETWARPPQWTTMHRPSIGKVSGDRIILDGTTIEEVEKYHRETLLVVIERVNQEIAELEARKRREAEAALQRKQQHESTVNEMSKRIKFD